MNTLEQLDVWRLLAGLGMFLFGMFMMEESIRHLSGRAFKSLIRRYTSTRLRGILSGLTSTAILQSSSAVSLMVLAFCGAGLMSLTNALAVMIGSKVGTTMTAWIVAVFGFKFKIEAFALPMIGIGGLGLILLAKSPRYVNVSKLLVAFGFLFHGLDFMKSSVEGLAENIDIAALPDLGIWFYALLGLLLTAIMQSSSATIAITLTMLHGGVVGFAAAAAMVIGANVGTTVTVLLGSMGGITVKKQAAFGQLLFTTGTAAVTFLMLPFWTWFVLDLAGLGQNTVVALALFHSLFNVMGVALFYPLIPALARFVDRRIPEPPRTHLTRYIDNTSPEVAEAAVEALRKEVLGQAKWSIDLVRSVYDLDPGSETSPRNELNYDDVEQLHAEIFSFYARIIAHEIEEREARRLEPYVRASRSIMNAAKNLYEQSGEIDEYRREDNEFMQDAWHRFLDRLSIVGAVVDEIAEETDVDHAALLEKAFAKVEETDKQFIHSFASAVATMGIRERDVTRLLMSNRLFTQSCRMLALSLQSLNLPSAMSGSSSRVALSG